MGKHTCSLSPALTLTLTLLLTLTLTHTLAQTSKDNLFESEYCIKEMEAAIECKCNIILVVKEGSR